RQPSSGSGGQPQSIVVVSDPTQLDASVAKSVAVRGPIVGQVKHASVSGVSTEPAPSRSQPEGESAPSGRGPSRHASTPTCAATAGPASTATCPGLQIGAAIASVSSSSDCQPGTSGFESCESAQVAWVGSSKIEML